MTNQKKAVQGYNTKPVVDYANKAYYYPDHGVTVNADTKEEADEKILSLTEEKNAKSDKRGDTNESN